MCLPVLLLLAGGGAVATYTPFGGGEEPADGDEILRLSMYVTGIARNLYSIWREYKQ